MSYMMEHFNIGRDEQKPHELEAGEGKRLDRLKIGNRFSIR